MALVLEHFVGWCIGVLCAARASIGTGRRPGAASAARRTGAWQPDWNGADEFRARAGAPFDTGRSTVRLERRDAGSLHRLEYAGVQLAFHLAQAGPPGMVGPLVATVPRIAVTSPPASVPGSVPSRAGAATTPARYLARSARRRSAAVPPARPPRW